MYELADLGPKEVRVKSELTAAKHGTEHSELLGKSIYSKVPYLEDKKVFDRSQEQEHDPSQWRGVGNTTVGRVIEVGSEVTDLKEGNQVWGYGNFRTVHQGGHFQLMPDGFSPEAACCMDPANFALAAVRDGNIRVGEKVIVFGMGAIGLFTVQLARFSGAIDVVAVDDCLTLSFHYYCTNTFCLFVLSNFFPKFDGFFIIKNFFTMFCSLDDNFLVKGQ